MNYELAKQLKDAGFPKDDSEFYLYEEIPDVQVNGMTINGEKEHWRGVPTLEELIEACGEVFCSLEQHVKGVWIADCYGNTKENTSMFKGKTPAEAVAKLWLALNQKEHVKKE